MIRLQTVVLLLVLLVVVSGCQAPSQTTSDTRLTCKYYQAVDEDIEDEWLANNITSWEELPNKTKRNLTGIERNSTRRAFRVINYRSNLTRYENMPEREKELFLRLINNETSIGNGTYPNAIYVREVNESTVSYLTERKFFIYQNDIHFCGTATPQGA
jgi:hypothetical protein